MTNQNPESVNEILGVALMNSGQVTGDTTFIILSRHFHETLREIVITVHKIEVENTGFAIIQVGISLAKYVKTLNILAKGDSAPSAGELMEFHKISKNITSHKRECGFVIDI